MDICRAGYGGGVVGVWGGRSVEVARERRSLENYPGMFVVVICNVLSSPSVFSLQKTNKKNAPLAEIIVAGSAAGSWRVCSRQ